MEETDPNKEAETWETTAGIGSHKLESPTHTRTPTHTCAHNHNHAHTPGVAREWVHAERQLQVAGQSREGVGTQRLQLVVPEPHLRQPAERDKPVTTTSRKRIHISSRLSHNHTFDNLQRETSWLEQPAERESGKIHTSSRLSQSHTFDNLQRETSRLQQPAEREYTYPASYPRATPSTTCGDRQAGWKCMQVINVCSTHTYKRTHSHSHTHLHN